MTSRMIRSGAFGDGLHRLLAVPRDAHVVTARFSRNSSESTILASSSTTKTERFATPLSFSSRPAAPRRGSVYHIGTSRLSKAYPDRGLGRALIFARPRLK